jgi:hypothetical protein
MGIFKAHPRQLRRIASAQGSYGSQRWKDQNCKRIYYCNLAEEAMSSLTYRRCHVERNF